MSAMSIILADESITRGDGCLLYYACREPLRFTQMPLRLTQTPVKFPLLSLWQCWAITQQWPLSTPQKELE